MDHTGLDKRFQLAPSIAKSAGRLLARLFSAPTEDLRAEFKAVDGDTPRTIIDTQVGDLIRSELRRQFPDDHIVEEESGYEAGRNGWRWFVDPFDGTSNVIPRLHQSVVGIGATFEGVPVLGIAMQPFTEELFSAATGKGAFRSVPNFSEPGYWNQETIRVVRGRPVAARFVGVDALWNARTAPRKARFLEQMATVAQNLRCTGSNILDSSRVATGQLEAWLMDAVGGPWDIVPGIVLITEAGGKVTDLQGNVPALDGTCQLVLGTNGELHEPLLAIARDCYRDYGGFR